MLPSLRITIPPNLPISQQTSTLYIFTSRDLDKETVRREGEKKSLSKVSDKQPYSEGNDAALGLASTEQTAQKAFNNPTPG